MDYGYAGGGWSCVRLRSKGTRVDPGRSRSVVAGEWSSEPQNHYERTVRMPAEGEHEPWYRTFARIDAPQIGTHVFYGQINIGGRDGPLYLRAARSSIRPRSTSRAASFWCAARCSRMPTSSSICRIARSLEAGHDAGGGHQLRFHLASGWRTDRRCAGRRRRRVAGGPGTCTFTSTTGKKFFADAEWTLTPDTLWLYDINDMDGQRFIGRKDRTHNRLYRARPYRCFCRGCGLAPRGRILRSGRIREVKGSDGRALHGPLLRAHYPAADGFGSTKSCA